MKLHPKAILAIIIAVFFIIELKGLFHYENSDENIYFYMGNLIAEGKIPYRDFFFAHPPLKIYLNAILIKIFGFHLPILKLVPLIATIISAIFIFKLMKENFGSTEGLIASSLFLFSYPVMLESTYATGINLTLMFAISGLYFLYAKKYLLSGILFGISSITGLYSLVYVAIIFIFLFFSSKKNLIKYSLGFLAVFLTINMLFLFISNGAYFASVYEYHLLKPKLEGNTTEVFKNVIVKSPILFALALLFIFNYTKKLQLIGAITMAYIIFLFALNRIFNFYFVLLTALLAMLASFSLARIAENTKKKAIVFCIVYFMLALSVLLTINHLYNFDFSNFETSKEIALFVRQNSNESATIFGDDTSTPLIALYSNRKIAYDMVDTNFMVFKSNVVSLDSTISKMKSNPPKFVIVRPLYNIGSLPEFSLYLQENCRLVKQFKDPQWADFLVYDCEQS